jgi:hypothetical protein
MVFFGLYSIFPSCKIYFFVDQLRLSGLFFILWGFLERRIDLLNREYFNFLAYNKLALDKVYRLIFEVLPENIQVNTVKELAFGRWRSFGLKGISKKPLYQ